MSTPIVYFDLAGPDRGKLRDFYSSAFGWDIDADFTIAARSTGGLRGVIREDPPDKVIYLGVPDIVVKLREVEAAGGQTLLPRRQFSITGDRIRDRSARGGEFSGNRRVWRPAVRGACPAPAAAPGAPWS
jgi:predicted enzyme related to lactoylglutathione lyase